MSTHERRKPKRHREIRQTTSIAQFTAWSTEPPEGTRQVQVSTLTDHVVTLPKGTRYDAPKSGACRTLTGAEAKAAHKAMRKASDRARRRHGHTNRV